jgi:carbonic anhydrase
MLKLLKGVIDFHERVRPTVKESYAKLALGQAPDALFIACSDSRVAANVFASTDPGDVFVLRNVGNLIPPCGISGRSVADDSEAAAIEFAVAALEVKHIVLCGHSGCGAMQALLDDSVDDDCLHLQAWLRHGRDALHRLRHGHSTLDDRHAPHDDRDRFSQHNVLAQMDHLMSYPLVYKRVKAGKLKLHGWWFHIAEAEVSAYDQDLRRFVVIDDKTGPELLRRLG